MLGLRGDFMQDYKLYIGSHCGLSLPEGFVGTVKEAMSYGSNTFMFYTGAPQNTYRKPVNELKAREGLELAKEAGFDMSKVIVHAPYIVNAANLTKPELYEMSIKVIISELQRTAAFNVNTLVLHPGAHVSQGFDVAIEALAKALDVIFDNDGTNVKIALETMAGKGTEIGITFEQIAKIISLCKHKDRLGVCLDTCHISDAGYDVNDVDGVLDEFDRVIGLDKLLCLHINDSKNPRAAHKDRHENLGYGYIGFETLHKYVTHPKLNGVPKILETPYVNEKPPYKEEISMLRSGQFVEGWREKL